MKNFINGFIRSDYDMVILRLSVITIFMLFGTYKWFDFEVMALEPLISTTWLNILYILFGVFLGNTPTDVGKTCLSAQAVTVSWKHPHGRGEDSSPVSPAQYRTETPPRTWGRLCGRGFGKTWYGNTPTDVGKTAQNDNGYSLSQKHPHGRGEDDE